MDKGWKIGTDAIPKNVLEGLQTFRRPDGKELNTLMYEAMMWYSGQYLMQEEDTGILYISEDAPVEVPDVAPEDIHELPYDVTKVRGYWYSRFYKDMQGPVTEVETMEMMKVDMAEAEVVST